ncbi:hypothetical protein WG901_08245 [Novosphingobium sp. PS1R-30]|uniref:Uncharacterized protein n=1 Tax=Novosphingobium anseongense TaxID=3133436 RepID=A0ABU8RUD3_9SPHN
MKTDFDDQEAKWKKSLDVRERQCSPFAVVWDAKFPLDAAQVRTKILCRVGRARA